MNLEKVKKIYFIGIGGIGMSAVAGIAKEKGYEVSGSDASGVYEPSKGVLDRGNIPYSIGYAAENFESADLVVTTPAVDQSNPEVSKAMQMGVPIAGFAELLAELTKDKQRIVVVGTHGKGTTSGLISYALKNLEDSGFFVGAVLTDLQTNFHIGAGDNFVIEGDEYKANFDNNKPKFSFYNPDILLINNIEFDHPDLYPTLEDFKKPFRDLVQSMRADQKIIFNADDSNVLDIIKDSPAQKIGFGFSSDSNILANRPKIINNFSQIEIKSEGGEKAVYFTKLPGMVYAYDILAAVAVLSSLGYNEKQLSKLVKDYSGVKRRYEIIEDDKITIIDDYAHHPTAVRQTLEATRDKYPQRRIICFFEPHTYSRTKETLPELENAFGSADVVYLAEVYPAREQKLPSSITGQEVLEHIAKHHPRVHYVKNKEAALEQFKDQVKEGDVIVVMAVGSFNTLVNDLKNIYAEHSK